MQQQRFMLVVGKLSDGYKATGTREVIGWNIGVACCLLPVACNGSGVRGRVPALTGWSSRHALRGSLTPFVSLSDRLRRAVLARLRLLAASMRPNPGFLSSFDAVDCRFRVGTRPLCRLGIVCFKGRPDI